MNVAERAARIVSAPAVVAKRPPREGKGAFGGEWPEDLAALWAIADGLELEDGTRLLGLEEVGPATRWLVEEKSLGWDDELFVIGERGDRVIVLDVDRAGKRAGGGVLEATTDGLEELRRVALTLCGYLETRAGLGPDEAPAPEVAAERAAAARDASGLASALAAPFYPGSEASAAHAALVLGELCAASGDDVSAMRAFERSVAFRVRGARRGAEALERAAGLRAAARVAAKVGAMSLSETCLLRIET